MTELSSDAPFYAQSMLSDLYYHKDLLDFTAPGTPKHNFAVSLGTDRGRAFFTAINRLSGSIWIVAIHCRCRRIAGRATGCSCRYVRCSPTCQTTVTRYRWTKKGGPMC